ncbi:MAG: hypothetical protein Tsb0015_08020 [Simkaniaceae bacterium]
MKQKKKPKFIGPFLALLLLPAISAMGWESKDGSFQFLSLNSAIEQTLEHQWNIFISEVQVRREEGLYRRSKGPFDPLLNFRISQTWGRDYSEQLGLDIPSGTSFDFPIVGTVTARDPGGVRVNTETAKARASLSKMTRIGTEFAVGSEISREKNPFFLLDQNFVPTFDTFEIDYIRMETTSVFFTVNQPFLKNFRYGLDATNEKSQQYRTTASKYDLMYNISSQVLKTILAYWDLVKAKKLLKARIKAEMQNKRYVKLVEDLIKYHQYGEAEISQPMRALENAKTNVTEAQQNIINQAQNLIFAMGTDQDYTALCSFAYSLEDYPQIGLESFLSCQTSAEAAIATALTRRPDIKAIEFREKAAEMEVKGAYNQTLPEVNVYLQGKQTNTTYEKDAKTFFSGYDMPAPQRELTVAVSFSLPLFRDESKGEYMAARANKRQVYLEEQRLRHEITSHVVDALNNHFSLLKKVKESSLALLEAEKYVEQQETLFQAGLTNMFQLLDSHNKKVDQEIRDIEINTAYYSNLAQMHFLLGTLVQEDPQSGSLKVSNVMEFPLNLSFGLSSSDSDEVAMQILGFLAEVNGQGSFTSAKSTRGASKLLRTR